MKILQVIPAIRNSGAERFTVDLCNELNALGHSVYLLILKPVHGELYLKSQLSEGVRLIEFSQPTNLGIILQLSKLLRTEKFNIVNTHMRSLNYVVPWRLLSRTTFCHTVHNNAKYETRYRLFKAIRRVLFRLKLVHPITLSHESDTQFSAVYGLSGTVIYNGTRKLDHEAKAWQSLLHQTPSVSYDYTFLSVGRITEQKNHRLLLNVFKALQEEGVSAQLLIMGDALDRELFEHLVKIKPSNVHFLGHVDDATSYLTGVDAFCLSSRWEGMPITVIEALASGTVVITTNVGGIREMIDESCGLIVTSIDEAAYKKALLSFMNMSSSDRQAISKNAIKKYQTTFTMTQCARHYETFYRRHTNAASIPFTTLKP